MTSYCRAFQNLKNRKYSEDLIVELNKIVKELRQKDMNSFDIQK